MDRLKSKKIITTFILTILLITSVFLITNKSRSYKEIPRVKLKENKELKEFALMLEQENGEYKESTGELPTEGYVFNKEKSGCIDINGKIIDDALNYDYDNYTIILNTGKTSFCYLYYDIEPNISYLRSKDTDNHLSKDLTGGMYRYQGLYEKDDAGNVTNDVENYICLGEDCTEYGNDLYRIIGINAQGELKVIKKTVFNSLTWSLTRTTDVLWKDSYIYNKLMESDDSFYKNLNSDLQSAIVEKEIIIGSVGESNLNGEDFYAIESGKRKIYWIKKEENYTAPTGSIYCGKVTLQEAETVGTTVCYRQVNDFWTYKTTSKVQLIRNSDYFLSINSQIMCTKEENYDTCKKSWLHVANNDTISNPGEWIMDKGNYGYTNDEYCGQAIMPNGGTTCSLKKYYLPIRPIIFLSSNIKLSGEGTLAKPFTLF